MTENKISLINLGKLSKPISKLIEAVSQGIGTLYEPTKIRRKAKAQADASLIKVESDIRKKDLLRRAANRLAFQEISRQENIESIIKIAANSLPATVSEDHVDKDWISRFFDECKDVSNEELQKIWGRLLAGEVALPDSCSRKTLAILKELSPWDCKLFTRLCHLIWSSGRNHFIPYRKDVALESQLGKYNINYGELLHLENLGLMHSKFDISYSLNIKDKELNYFKLIHSCSADDLSYEEENTWVRKISVFPLSKYGIELFSVAKPEPNNFYYEESIIMFKDFYNISLYKIPEKNT